MWEAPDNDHYVMELGAVLPTTECTTDAAIEEHLPAGNGEPPSTSGNEFQFLTGSDAIRRGVYPDPIPITPFKI